MPGVETLLPIRVFLFELVFELASFLFDLRNLFELLVGVDPRNRFIVVVQKRQQSIVLLVRDRIELVRMALSALNGEAEHGFAQAIEPIEQAFHAKLLVDDGAFFIDHAVARGGTWGALDGTNVGETDAFIAKYDAFGNLAWKFQLGTPAMEEIYGIASDGMGNLYVSGSTGGSLGGPNLGLRDAFIGA